jgi:hypothetical protein
MINEELIQYVKDRILTNIDSTTFSDVNGSFKAIKNQYRIDFGKELSSILLEDVVHILKLRNDKSRTINKKLVLDNGKLRTYPA